MRPLFVLWAAVAVVGPGPASIAEAGPPPTVAVSLTPEAARAVKGLPAIESRDYGSFVWLEVAEADLERFRREVDPRKIVAQPFSLSLGGVTFDPLVGDPGLPDEWRAPRVAGADLHLVQVPGPTRDGWLEDLERSGVRVVQYIHPHTYVVWGEEPAVTRAARSVDARWTGRFDLAFRILPRWRNLKAHEIPVRALVYRGAGVGRVIEDLSALGARVGGSRPVNATWAIVTFEAPGASLRSLAAVPGVFSLQPAPTDGGSRGEMSDQVNVGNVGEDNLAFPGYAAWLEQVDLAGDGVVIANVDEGVQDDHPDLAARLGPCVGETCGGSTTSSHGTHTAGIMAGDGASGALDGAGFARGLGVAPGAALVEQIWDPVYAQPGGMLQLMTESLRNGASVSGNSWGPSSSPLGYDADTLQVDVGVRDADPDLEGNQSLLYVLSIMNGNGGTSTQGTPDEAKNVLTVGSTRMQYSDLSQDLGIDDLSYNTAHGPALDGRNIPHLVAPGCRVDSTLPAATHGTMCGTSMASPNVSGAAALLVQRRREAGFADPSPALVKAFLLATARSLAGHLDADGGVLGHPFDVKQGWGRMDLAAAVDFEAAVLAYDAPVEFGATGEFWGFETTARDPTRPVRVMLVWTDAPGHGLGGATPAWNNDLDLEVQAGEETYLGNVFDPATGWSAAGGTADFRNNTEGVFLPAPQGSLHILVRAANITSDGVPGTGDPTDQDFALVCFNCGSRSIFEDDFESGGSAAWSKTVP